MQPHAGIFSNVSCSCFCCALRPWLYVPQPPSWAENKSSPSCSFVLQPAPSGWVLRSLPIGLAFYLKQGFVLRGTSLLNPLLDFCFLVRVCFCSLFLHFLSRLKYMPYCHFEILRVRNKVNRKMVLTCYYYDYHSLEEVSNCINWPVVTTVNRHSFRTEMPLVLGLPQWLRW